MDASGAPRTARTPPADGNGRRGRGQASAHAAVPLMDWHVHSCYSDGLLTPDALCELAVRRKIAVLGLCDHDTTEGLAPMARAVARVNGEAGRECLRLLPSVELSTGPGGNTHVLGYGVDPANDELQAALRGLRRKRVARGQEMLRRLRALGWEIPPEALPRGDSPIGRAHLGRGLIAAGAVNTLEQAFDRFLGEGRPAYVPLEHQSTAAAVALLTRARAVPVLAHPMRIGLKPPLLEALVRELTAAGLRGLEVYHPSASRRDLPGLLALARRLNLLVTGGSDFHGDRASRSTLGGVPSGWNTRADDLDALLAAMERAWSAPRA